MATCRFCGAPVFGDSVLDGDACLQHVELKLYIWRLQKRGEAITEETLRGYMTRVMAPQTFAIYQVGELLRQMNLTPTGQGGGA